MSSKKMGDGQSLAARDLVRAVDQLLSGEGKPGIDEVRIHLKERGFIRSDEDSILEWEREKAREALQLTRRTHAKAGEFSEEPIHLFEYLESGEKRDYWKAQGVLTAEEASQDTITWSKSLKIAGKRLRKKIDFHTDRLGDDYQRLLPFDIFEVA